MAESRAASLLIQFAREPVPGQVKTRMMPQLSAAQACQLHRELVLWTSAQLLASGLGDVELSVAGDIHHCLFQQCRERGTLALTQQRGADLGERMYRAIHRGLGHYERVILVGSDCPSIDAAYLDAALRGLDNYPLVLGPAQDGGYVLVGARQVSMAMFRDVAWGTAQVYEQTAQRLCQEGLKWHELPWLADVDRPEDLALWTQLSSEVG